MNRKEFLQNFLKTGLGCCTAGSALLGLGVQKVRSQTLKDDTRNRSEWIDDLEKRMIKGSETPAWKKAEKGKLWIKDLMENMDALFDRDAKMKLMQACGKSCYNRAFGVAPEEKPTALEKDQYIQFLKDNGYDVKREGSTTTFLFNWGRDHQNPWGLIMQDGYCMCPLVENGPEGLSPTFCYCSTGYVREIFQRRMSNPVRVELINSLKMGGDDCIFKIIIEDV